MLGYRNRFFAVVAVACLAAGCSTGGPPTTAPATAPAAPAAPAAVDRDAAVDAYGKLPLRFEANRGQVAPEVDFLARGSGYSVFLTGDEAVMALEGEKGAVVRMRLDGADPATSLNRRHPADNHVDPAAV